MLGGRFNFFARTEYEIVVADPFTGEVKNRVRAPYPNFQRRTHYRGWSRVYGFG